METIVENSTYTADQILCAALDVGVQILKNGGEIHRVEDTIERISKSLGAEHAEVFCITTLIVASVRLPNGDYSHQIRRVNKTKNDLNMVEQMNDLSRRICSGRLKLEDLHEEIARAKESKIYPNFVFYLAAILASSSFAIFFGGGILDGLLAAIAGTVITFVDRHMPKFINPMIVTVINSICGGIASIALTKLTSLMGLTTNLDMIMIGTIMLLIPGISLGNSIRDILGGDIVSGFLRLLQSVIIALMIAIGYASSILLFGIQEVSQMVVVEEKYWVIILTGVLGTLGFGLSFNVKQKRILWIMIGGFVSSLVYVLAENLGPFTCNMLAALALTFYAEAITRMIKAPAIVFIMTGVVPLVPGRALYYTIFYLIKKNASVSGEYGFSALAICLGIAVGILIASLIVNCITILVRKKKKARNI